MTVPAEVRVQSATVAAPAAAAASAAAASSAAAAVSRTRLAAAAIVRVVADSWLVEGEAEIVPGGVG